MSTKNYYAPVRPPRGSKVSKDTSGRLMNIIAELSVSKSNEDRKRKMDELKKDFFSSDARLLKLISGHREQLSVIMESFSKISAKINTSRRGCRDVREKLTASKKLLECKRDDIRRLWTESVEHQGVISILKEIDDLNNVHDRVEECLKDRQILKATELLVSALSLLENKLSQADALKDLKAELNTLKKKLHLVCVEEIHELIYKEPSNVFLKKASDDACESSTKTYDELFSNQNNSTIKLPIDGSCYDSSSRCFNYQQIAVLLECLCALNTLPETVEVLKDNCSKELMLIINNSTEIMYNNIQNGNVCYSGTENVREEGQPHFYHYLQDLLNVILNQFRQVAVNHYAFLDNLERISMTKNLTDVTHYEMADIYSKIQAAIELFITDYLDLHNTAATERAAAAFSKVPTNISSYFLRKGNITRAKRKPNSLFRFDSSSHAINKKTYFREQREIEKKEKGELDSADSSESDKSFLIAQPNVKNIKIVYKSLAHFICEMEIALRMENGDQCPLHTFLCDSVKLFLDQVSIDVNRLIERSSISLETWKPVKMDLDELKSSEAKTTQILNSTVAVNSSLKEMEELIYALPDYSTHFLQLMCNVLQNYSDLCNGAYKSLILYGDSEDQKIFSVSWARDSDISRLLRSLPNWTNLEIDDASSHDYQESPEEIHFRNKAESDLLIRNLSCKDSISPSEIISEHEKLTNLALMHESMEWFSSRILRFSERLPDVQASVASLYMSEKLNEEIDSNDIAVGVSTKGCLKKLAKDFEDLASSCLLVLHLEVRAHCFYYLLELSKGSYINRKDDEEPEPEILKLNADLSKIDESLSPVLQPKKMRYIFEGLGELLSTILINCVSNVKKINENGVKKMGRNIFAIQQNLATITMTREVALDRARQYFDLLNHSYEDILNQIMEEGPQFQEHEYSAIIQLLHNSREGIYDQESLIYYLEKLRQILDEVAVSV